ncbi:MAG: NmrA/HSCARG family protein, partial [Acidobacteriaceae bacterium]|nr:NmrA/HSCARG family protein [Acidobacteriaceae bacterium]
MAHNKDRTIAVTGATGHQGGAVLRHLREKHFPVRALTRDANSPKVRTLMTPGVEPVSADLDDLASLERALDDVYGVYSVQPFTDNQEEEIRQGNHLIDAANREEISHFVYSSVAGADASTGIPHFESKGKIEEHLRNSGLPYTIFRPVFFMENWLG